MEAAFDRIIEAVTSNPEMKLFVVSILMLSCERVLRTAIYAADSLK